LYTVQSQRAYRIDTKHATTSKKSLNKNDCVFISDTIIDLLILRDRYTGRINKSHGNQYLHKACNGRKTLKVARPGHIQVENFYRGFIGPQALGHGSEWPITV
jgi:hypothetical protein